VTHTFRPATRENTQLIIGSIGASGSGKTYSLFELATGLAYPEANNAEDLARIVQAEGRNRIVSIDTERGRALHYAPPPGQRPDPWKQGAATFAFDHAELNPPFSPDAYMAMTEAADEAGYRVIIIDSGSHEWAGEGGVLEWQENEMQEAATRRASRYNRQPTYQDLEAVKMQSWIKPKMAHKRLVGRITTLRAHLLIALRGEEKVRMEKDPQNDKKTVVIAAADLPPNKRWSPVCEKSFPFELTMSFVLSPEAPGFPHPLKLQEQHRPYLPLDRAISIETGRALAAWAGGSGAPAAAKAKASPEELTQRYIDGLANVASLDDLGAYQERASKFLGQLKTAHAELHQRCVEANGSRYSELSQSATVEEGVE
jgi:hypothetical protein